MNTTARAAIVLTATLLTAMATGGVAIAGPVAFFPGTGSYYEVVETSVTWAEAEAGAAALVHLGRQGRLATITSAEENDFVVSQVLPNVSEGDSYWLGGVQTPGSAEPAGGWHWITNEPFVYTNWRPIPQEPSNDDIFGFEDRIEIFNALQNGTWNDLAAADSALSEGYVVEYAATSPAMGVPLPAALPAALTVIPLAAWSYHRERRGRAQPRH